MFFIWKTDDPQVLFADTEMLPDAVLVIIEMVFVTEVPDQPPGNTHVYDVAPGTANMLYVFDIPLQTTETPLIIPGCVGGVQVPVLKT